MKSMSRAEKKWVKANLRTPWNVLFSDFAESDIMLAKLMAYECVNFSDKLLNSHVFVAENTAARIDTILLAKMHFYHLVTKSATMHNLFYGYLHELYTNHYKKDLHSANSALDTMRSKENWYLTMYYYFYEKRTGDFKRVMDQYCQNIDSNKTTDGLKVLATSTNDLREIAARELLEMHHSFLAKIVSDKYLSNLRTRHPL